MFSLHPHHLDSPPCDRHWTTSNNILKTLTKTKGNNETEMIELENIIYTHIHNLITYILFIFFLFLYFFRHLLHYYFKFHFFLIQTNEKLKEYLRDKMLVV
uniref:Uncharacterized protein n=1 Tax=Cacopsylla melanoneura TaxID=428564 RepID=A0A8D8R4S6_9HEMI